MDVVNADLMLLDRLSSDLDCFRYLRGEKVALPKNISKKGNLDSIGVPECRFIEVQFG